MYRGSTVVKQLLAKLSLLYFSDLNEGFRALGWHLWGCHSARLNTLLLFQKNPDLNLKQPYNSLLWASSWTRALEKMQARLQTVTPTFQSPACLPKLQTMCILFNSKHRISTFHMFIRQSTHGLNVSHYWSQTVLRHLMYQKDCQMGHDNHSFQLYPSVNLGQQKDLCLSHITSPPLISISVLRFTIDSSMLSLRETRSIRTFILLNQIIAEICTPFPSTT